MNRKQILQVLVVGIFLLGTYFFLGKVGTYLQSNEVRVFITQAGILAPLAFSIIYLLSMIFAPLTGLPFWIASVGLFGIFQTVTMVYFVSLVGSIINFYIARKFGRPILAKLVGNHGLERIDRLSKNAGMEVLILARLFQGFIFEWISYASGLTNFKFRTYFLTTVLASVPLNLLSLFLGSRINNLGELFMSITVANYILMTVPFIYFLFKRLYIQNK